MLLRGVEMHAGAGVHACQCGGACRSIRDACRRCMYAHTCMQAHTYVHYLQHGTRACSLDMACTVMARMHVGHGMHVRMHAHTRTCSHTFTHTPPLYTHAHPHMRAHTTHTAGMPRATLHTLTLISCCYPTCKPARAKYACVAQEVKENICAHDTDTRIDCQCMLLLLRLLVQDFALSQRQVVASLCQTVNAVSPS